ncbi:hypothetical protein G3I60_04800 [Streptomyces sp. SID13666]|uniref:hypothetical protein n=1 Tax=unclassified Streptomyces TaxID=2593676 RepID=UPI0013C0DB47|nr:MULTISPECIES: hypothetical protein [unclassified Streptomyces]NEA53490.1 hypothetical protein [Streptomyces sp. SID13666]NEA69186.1 hypothetical protein [Streptomyces sp. SID13588]
MTFESTRRQALRVALGGLAASCLAGHGQPAAAASNHKAGRPEYQARYRELFNACGRDLDKKVLVGQQLLDNYERDARTYHVPDRAAVVRMQDALVRQRHARRIGASS